MSVETAMEELVGGDAAADLTELFSCLSVTEGRIAVEDDATLRRSIGNLARIGAFGSSDARRHAHRVAWEIANSLGIFPASIDALYRAIGRGEIDRRFTVPAINVRAIAFQSARGVFSAMKDVEAGAVIFELSRGEIGFTAQRPREYATSIFCAAIAEGHRGPVFLQGDHFQISASRFAEDPVPEVSAVAALISEAVGAGFFNIDVDTSTLVDLSQSSVREQQRPNFELTAILAWHTRDIEPDHVTISLGGEIGEVGEHNSTAEEVQAYLDGVTASMPAEVPGLTKLSIQSGTRHGGNVLADGSFGDMPIDFALIDGLSGTCRNGFGLAGCVQHGASLLPMEKIAQLPEYRCVEVHLAAAFLNVVYETLPAARVRDADEWAKQKFAQEWRADWSEAQFLHHARRYPIGPFKQTWWDEEACHDAVRSGVRTLARSYFSALRVDETRDLVNGIIAHEPVDWIPPADQTDCNDHDEIAIKDLAS
ncbi:class II fructose-bisphosphate aldolase [Pelagibius sp. Alg239-R121]|uniref:class II fructose-bisphosphate aldolase n=1 Tax=Pelagibius sp. Alg239-R121 TaxID=2993448 RepID=UPI0024A661AA|nr:class II fructose-bisphosphate aldolase [Pelagibius sp. Alg239-R121]